MTNPEMSTQKEMSLKSENNKQKKKHTKPKLATINHINNELCYSDSYSRVGHAYSLATCKYTPK